MDSSMELDMCVQTIKYIHAVKKFNAFNGFEINLSDNTEIYPHLIQYTDEVVEHTKMLERYHAIREQGFSDDHLATEIGLFVLHLNKKTNQLLDDPHISSNNGA